MPAKPKARSRSNGQGTVYRARDKFRWQLVLPGRGGREGLRIGGVEVTREAAELKLVQARADVSRQVRPGQQGSKLTYREYAALYFQQPRGWAETTQRSYQVLSNYAADHFGATPLHQLQASDVRGLLRWLTTRPSQSPRNKGETLGLGTINTALWLCRSIFAEALVDEHIAVNPCLTIRSVRPQRREQDEAAKPQKVFDFPDAERFCTLGHALHAAGLINHWPGLFAILSLGLRRGEAAGLRWSDVSLDDGVLHIRQSRNNLNKLSAPKTRSSQRKLPIPPSLLAVLRELPRTAIPVFAYRGGYVNAENFRKTMALVLRWSDPENLDQNIKSARAGTPRLMTPESVAEVVLSGDVLPDIGVHGLRHTYATLALRRGVPVEVVSKTLGHSQISMTYNVYRHVLDAELKTASLDLFSFDTQDEPVAPALHTEKLKRSSGTGRRHSSI